MWGAGSRCGRGGSRCQVSYNRCGGHAVGVWGTQQMWKVGRRWGVGWAGSKCGGRQQTWKCKAENV